MNELLYRIGITLIPGIGNVRAKRLISHFGNAQAVFTAKKTELLSIPEIGENTAKLVLKQDVLKRAEEEINYIQKNKVQALCYLDDEYPSRLKYCDDGPVMLFAKGNMNLQNEKIISIVGTRKATEYGKNCCEKIVKDLVPHNPIILSGLAYGIDIAAHRAAIKNELQTIAVVAHGLDQLYPNDHSETAEKMKKNGGLLSEYLSETVIEPEYFPVRNRIVAGMCDAVIVVEAAAKGGALITAELANGYSRDVFAVPGKLGDQWSEGCNKLIKINKAALYESVADLEYLLGWNKAKDKKKRIQKQLFVELNESEQSLVDILATVKNIHIDELSFRTKLSNGQLSGILLNLELKGVVKVSPGRLFELL